MKNTFHTLAALLAATSQLLVLPSTHGSTTETDSIIELPPLVVTGDIWDTLLSRTSASVTLIDEKTLERNGTEHFGDLINAIPNLTWTGGTSRPRYLQIRGIGENSQFEGETPDSTIRFLIDDIDLTGLGTVGSLFDVQQVEVLRGPQAGAFGANAAGGLVRIVTNEPTPYWTGQIEGTVGNDNLRSGGFALGGPLLENDPEQLSFRLALQQHVQDGFRENRFLNRDDTNERDEQMARLKLHWKPSKNWQLDGTLFYADADNGYDEFSLNNAEFETFSDEPGRDEQESLGSSIRGKWTGLDKADLTSITQFTNTDSLYSYDADWGTGDGVASPFPSGYTGFLQIDREREVFSEELRFDSRDQNDAFGLIDRWTLGLFYHQLDETSDISYDESSEVFAYAGNVTVASDYETETFALFSQASHDLSENTRIILGLRFEHHEVEFSSDTLNDTLGYITNPNRLKSSQDDDLWGGKLTLEHDVRENHLLFASITRGYKAGGANSGTFNLPEDPAIYETEILWNYEAGVRSSWLDDALNSSVTLFCLDRKNAQLRDSAGAGGFFRYFTSNQGDAEHFGAEAELTWSIHSDWRVNATLGLLETRNDVNSRDLANAPNYTYSLRFDYRPQDGFFASAELAGSDAYYESNSHREKRSSYSVVNTSVGYRYKEWTFTLWVRNLFDEAYEQRVFFFDNFDPDGAGTQRYESLADPRQVGLTAAYRF